ncbi:MAG: (d)CMP kinase [Phycisphaerae bacterium]
MAELIITIDGPAGSGKSTVAKKLAEKLGAQFLDTGAMYRAVTLAAMNRQIDLSDEAALIKLLEDTKFQFEPVRGLTKVIIDGCDATEQIRGFDVTANAKFIASASGIRAKLVEMQRNFAEKMHKVVTEGRDQGTVAFPDAQVKFFLDADIEERAKRRLAELGEKGRSFEQIKQAIEKRDASDRQRTYSPLKAAADAVTVDTTNMTIEQVVDKLFGIIWERCLKNT